MEERMLKVEESEFFCRVGGSGSPILLIHGMAGDADVWGKALDILAEDHRVIAYDRRGFTRSKHEPVRDLERHRLDAAALLRELDPGPVTVVGWSSGGIIALDLAIREPELVKAAVLIEAPLHAKRRPGMRQVRAVIGAQLLSRIRDERAATEVFMRWALRYRDGDTGYDRLDPATRDAMLANGKANMGEIAAGTGEHIRREQVAKLAVPLTCVVGELSDPVYHRATAYIRRLAPRTSVKHIDGAGHGLHLERPAEFAAAVKEAAG